MEISVVYKVVPQVAIVWKEVPYVVFGVLSWRKEQSLDTVCGRWLVWCG